MCTSNLPVLSGCLRVTYFCYRCGNWHQDTHLDSTEAQAMLEALSVLRAPVMSGRATALPAVETVTAVLKVIRDASAGAHSAVVAAGCNLLVTMATTWFVQLVGDWRCPALHQHACRF